MDLPPQDVLEHGEREEDKVQREGEREAAADLQARWKLNTPLDL